MSAPDISLLGKRRFAPLFVVQFLGAFNDNVLKFTMLFLASYTVYQSAPEKVEQLSALATGLFILPYFLLSAIGGQLADRFDKAVLIRCIKGAEILFMAIGLAGCYFEMISLLMVALFLMGVHSALFGPVKYSIMPQHLSTDEIMGATGLIEAGTFLAILGGQLFAGLLTPLNAGIAATALATCGFLISFLIPPAPSADKRLQVDYNVFRSTWRIMSQATKYPGIWYTIVGISWFFGVGAVVLAEFIPLVNGVLGAQKEVATLFLIIFSVSIAIGSLAVNLIAKGKVSARFVPVAALGMAGSLIYLWIATSRFVVQVPGADIATFVASEGAWHILAALFGIAFSGGMFIVPLYAILMTQTSDAERSQIIAGNNIINAVMTVIIVLAVTAMLGAGASLPLVIGVLGLATIPVALGAHYRLRRALADLR
jgi:acyl-[acyl-carrier-protein]-phospholipid O-acyltransferase / long-chain-fatty-acid--[acyl-carrier-protein] ligase